MQHALSLRASRGGTEIFGQGDPIKTLIPTDIRRSTFGVIPKHGQVGKWRLIVDLSSPVKHSVNAGVTQDLYSISYTSVDEAVRPIQLFGCGTLDFKEVYRSIPVHPADRPLLAVQWRDTILVVGALPFGLRSAPKLFSAVTARAESLQCVLLSNVSCATFDPAHAAHCTIPQVNRGTSVYLSTSEQSTIARHQRGNDGPGI